MSFIKLIYLHSLRHQYACVWCDPAYPRDPFPSIGECAEFAPSRVTDCNVHTASPINITCSVDMYFPAIELFFRHAFIKIDVLSSRQWNNTDGTRNKSVTITASPSNDPYVCVASNIPGYGWQEKEAQLFLNLPLPSSTVMTGNTSITTQVPGRDSIGNATCEYT